MSILDQIAQGPKVGGLQIAEAGATGTKAGLEVATQSLANKISTAKYEDYLASAEQRRAARQADTMKSEEFVSPEQQQQPPHVLQPDPGGPRRQHKNNIRKSIVLLLQRIKKV